MIKAPYNFVPLENTAFYPEWANHISHDIPFEDGVSGSIEYTMEAKTPIFVRNGYPNTDYPKKGDKPNPDPTFSHIDVDGKHRYFIPGTSVKGEIRNILEILSFGKMTRVQDARFGIRTLRGSDRDRYSQSIVGEHCGWLIKGADGIYRINDCGKPGRIDTAALSDNLCNFMRSTWLDWDFFCQKSGCDKTENEVRASVREEIKRSSLLKYFIYGYSLTQLLDKVFFADARLNYSFSKVDIPRRNPFDTRMLYRRNENEGRRGTIVLTGQPSPTKKYDFIFFDKEKTIEVQDDIITDFKSIHKNNLDFKYVWEPRLESGKEIPVFFTFNSNGDQVISIGLSGMFRIPSANFIKGAIPAELQSKEHKDLAECIFGTADKVLRPLKGRVVFSPAFADDEVEELDEVRTTLSSPKPSYGPLYVKDGTWNDYGAQIKGRKRYPVRENIWSNETGNENTQTVFRPLAKDSKFSGKIYFHNLKQCELGALISAMTFNGHTECFHSIGEAKPLGYGKVKIDITSITDYSVSENVVASGINCVEKKSYYLAAFGELMSSRISEWGEDSASIRELLSMAKGIDASRDSLFRYMQLSTNGYNDFETFKGKNLELFTEITQNSDKNANAGDWNRKSQSDLNSEIANKFGIEAIMLEIKNLLDKGHFDLAYKWLSEYCREGSKLNAEYKSALNEELLKIKADVMRLLADARASVDKRDYASAARQYRKVMDYRILEYRNIAEIGLDKCENIYPKVEMLIAEGSLREAKEIVEGNNSNHSDVILNGFYEKIVRAEGEIEGADTRKKINRINELFNLANECSTRACSMSGDGKRQCLLDAVSFCKEALDVEVIGYDKSPLHRLKSKCEDELIRIGVPLKDLFVKLASMTAFASKVGHWKRDNGVDTLSVDDLTFLGNFIKDNLGTLKKKDQKPWLDHQSWNNKFASVFSPEDIDYMFNIVSGD